MTARQAFGLPLVFKGLCFTAGMLFSAVTTGAETDDPAANFVKNGIPFLEKHCLSCHGSKDPKGEISLHVYKDEATVLRGRKLLTKAVNLAISGEMPPKDPKNPKPRPPQQEIEAFGKAISGIFDKADRNAKPDPGRIAMRRLNRTEYSNTMRDLLGLDYNAAEDFPDDEVGHGFDNISDVQWLTPVLMERYLAAAESAAQRIVAIEPPKPQNRWQGGKHLEPAGNDVGDVKWRQVHGDKPTQPTQTGPLHNEYKIPIDGEYNFKARVYGKSDDGKPVKVAILACGKNVANPASEADAGKLFGAAVNNLRPFQIVKIVELKGKDEKSAENISAKIPPNTMFNRMAVAIVKPEGGAKTPRLFVENFQLEGPMDSRPAFQRANFDPPAGKTRDEHMRDFFQRFATRAYRRPPTPEEVERLTKIVKEAESAGQKWEAGMQLAIQSVLVSPKFLFRPELVHQSNNADMQPIGEYELASRLSYFLWSSMPDDELFALAEKKQLGANIDAQVKRMLKDPKSKAIVDNFAMQWLQLRRLYALTPDPKLFPNYSARLRDSMIKETMMFIDAIIREDYSILTMLDSDFTFVNDTLARHYGIVDANGNLGYKKAAKPKGDQIRGDNFRRISLADGDRGGLLGQASILTVTSNPTRTSPVKRGKWVLEQLLGTPPPPPAPDVPELESSKQLTGTLRQRMEQHRENPSCAGCHARMDPIGFAFENFDAIGAYRTKDGNLPIETGGVLPDGREFKNHVELKAVLKDKKDNFARCFTEKLLTYALGRGLELYDKRSVDKILEAIAKDNYKFSTLAIEIAKSDPFRLRRGKDEVKQ